jgi:hypothetical protein
VWKEALDLTASRTAHVLKSETNKAFDNQVLESCANRQETDCSGEPGSFIECGEHRAFRTVSQRVANEDGDARCTPN